MHFTAKSKTPKETRPNNWGNLHILYLCKYEMDNHHISLIVSDSRFFTAST